MALTVHLDRELRFSTIEVEHIGANRVLATELEAVQCSPTQTDPQSSLGRRQGATLNSRS